MSVSLFPSLMAPGEQTAARWTPMPSLDLLGRWSREEMVEGKATRIPSSVREATAEQRGGGRTLAAWSSQWQWRIGAHCRRCGSTVAKRSSLAQRREHHL